MKKLIILFLVGCGGSASLDSNQQQVAGGDSVPSNCESSCTLECAGSGGLSFEVSCQTFESEETQASGVASTIGDLPPACLNRPVPNCDEGEEDA